MNRSDKVLALFILLLAILTYLPIYLYDHPEDKVAVVYYRNKEMMRIDLFKNDRYHITGKKGDMIIEVKNGKIAVTKENSPYHLCSMQGFVSSFAEPIICLPNEIVICIEEKNQEELDVVIK